MKYDKTICKLLRNCEEQIIKAATNGTPFDASDVVKKIRASIVMANKMETGLERRKELMVNNNLEDLYQTLKAARDKKDGINEIADKDQKMVVDVEQRKKYTVVIKENDRVVYESSSVAGIFCGVEQIESIDIYDGVVQGRTQRFVWGHDLMALFALDQLRTTIQPMAISITQVLKKIQTYSKDKQADWIKGVMEANSTV